jgi:hypothetical protein
VRSLGISERKGGKGTMKRTGRPPLDEHDPSVYVGVTLPSKQYDTLCERAIREKVSVPEIIRRDLSATKKTTK